MKWKKIDARELKVGDEIRFDVWGDVEKRVVVHTDDYGIAYHRKNAEGKIRLDSVTFGSQLAGLVRVQVPTLVKDLKDGAYFRFPNSETIHQKPSDRTDVRECIELKVTPIEGPYKVHTSRLDRGDRIQVFATTYATCKQEVEILAVTPEGFMFKTGTGDLLVHEGHFETELPKVLVRHLPNNTPYRHQDSPVVRRVGVNYSPKDLPVVPVNIEEVK